LSRFWFRVSHHVKSSSTSVDNFSGRFLVILEQKNNAVLQDIFSQQLLGSFHNITL
ncbi:hypothetical protein M9458_049771, partial [Cirrhinus mrigala]